MTIEEYKDLLLEDEINIGYEVEEDDLPEEIEESSYVDELLTDGFHAVYDPKMTLDEYEDFKLLDEINIGYDLSEEYEEYEEEEESYIDGLKTSGFIPVEDDELFGEPIVGYSLY